MLNWNEIVHKYISKYSNKIKETTRPLKDHFNIEYFTYHRIENDGRYTVLVDRQEWAEYYVNEQLYINDPFLKHHSCYQSGMLLIDTFSDVEYRERIFKSSKQVLNLDSSLMLIKKDSLGVEYYGFSTDKSKASLQNLYLNHSKIFESFASYFKDELSQELIAMSDEGCSLIDLKGANFFNSNMINTTIEKEKCLSFYADIGLIPHQNVLKKLSKRELECLQHLLADKSASQTADLLGLSKRTIEFYFENIKNKLNCDTKHELLEIARSLHDAGFYQ